MNKHTPGPWAAHFDNSWNQWSVRSANTADLAEAPLYYELADRIGGHVRGERFDNYSEIEANARLIAAAPELLEALEQLKCEVILSDVDMDYIEHHFRPWLDKAAAAIAKARGEA